MREREVYVLADGLVYHHRDDHGHAVCGGLGAVIPIDVATGSGLAECGLCERNQLGLGGRRRVFDATLI